MYGYKYVPGYWEGLGLRVGLGLRAKFRIECRSVSNCVYAGMTVQTQSMYNNVHITRFYTKLPVMQLQQFTNG